VELNTKIRTIKGKKVKQLRNEGWIPLALYGKDIKEDLKVPAKEFDAVYNESGESSLLDLKVDGKDRKKVLIDQVQTHPVTGSIMHATLRQVDLTRKIKADIPLEFAGEPEIVKSGAGILLELINEIEVECLPTDLPAAIKVDTTQLKEIGDTILVKDLELDRKKVTIDLDEEEPVAKIDYAQMEEKEEEEISEEEAVAQVEASEEKEEAQPEEKGEEKEKGASTPTQPEE